MEHYVTLFDSLYLPQGLALHASMQRHAGAHRLWMLCVDETAFDVLTRLALPDVSLLKLSALETTDLLRVKKERTHREYCWTLTPFAPRFVFEADAAVRRVTYLDADLWFRKSPRPIFAEFERSGAGAMITEHGYAPECDQTEKSGEYCVQFMVFERDRGETVRKWWEERCIEWCYARFEAGKFGDQRYLDDWPVRFEGLVHVLEHQHWTQAPWNATRFPWSQAIVYHFQDLKILPRGRVDYTAMYVLPTPTRANVYAPYLKDLSEAARLMNGVGTTVRPQAPDPSWWTLLRRGFSGLYQQAWRWHRFNIKSY